MQEQLGGRPTSGGEHVESGLVREIHGGSKKGGGKSPDREANPRDSLFECHLLLRPDRQTLQILRAVRLRFHGRSTLQRLAHRSQHQSLSRLLHLAHPTSSQRLTHRHTHHHSQVQSISQIYTHQARSQK